MKKCTYCGKQYPDEAVVCAVDGQPLQPVASPGAAPPVTAAHHRSRKLLSYIAPVRAGLVLAIMYAFFGVIAGLMFVPFIIFGAVLDKTGNAPPVPAAVIGLFAAIFVPIMYAIIGFVSGLIAAAIYNLVAKWTGGLEFEVRDVAPAAYYG